MKTLALVAFCSVPLAAQATHVVGAGGFAQIQDALAVAQLDDTIVVQPGTYLPFVCVVGVRIVAPSGATVASIQQSGPSTPTVFAVATGQTAYVNGLTFAQAGALYPHLVHVVSGQAAFEQCTFSPTHPFEGYYTLTCSHADLVLQRCTFSTFNGAVSVDTGSLAAANCAFYGVDPQGNQTVMPAAVLVRNGTAQLAFCSLRGGNSGQIGQRACPGMRVEGSSKVQMVDCAVTGGDRLAGTGSLPPSTGLENVGTQPVRHLRTSFVGGWGAVLTPNGSWPVRGPGTSGLVQADTVVGLVGLAAGLRVNQSYGFDVSTAPSTMVVLGISFGLVSPTPVPPVDPPIRFDPSATSFYGMGSTDAAGIYSRSVTYSLPPAALGTPVWFHGIALDGTRLLSGNPVGGIVH